MAAAGRDTIAAIATAPGAGAVGVLRVSGAHAGPIAEAVVGRVPAPRRARLAEFRDGDGVAIDQGLALWFPAPGSFTGEDVLELQGHGGPQVLDLLLRRVLGLGARQARPGEFSERAYLNGKLDLVQAEAIADLIASATATQARLASRSLRGVFSRRVSALAEELTRLRVALEAALDFPDEELDASAETTDALASLRAGLRDLRARAQQGALIRDGRLVVIAGAANAGKSSLLNALCGEDTAIVTPIPGTTRDLLRAEIQLDGLPLRLVDTAGLRPSQDPIEQEGIRRARAEIAEADILLLVVDATAPPAGPGEVPDELPDVPKVIVWNKIDCSGESPGPMAWADGSAAIACSVRTGAGLDVLRARLRSLAGDLGAEGGEFLARRRHLEALHRCDDHLEDAERALAAAAPPELAAEELRLAQRALGEITGEVSSDELLGRIFSEFCIGK